MGKLRLCAVIAVVCVAGFVCSELLCRWNVFRDAAGRLFGRGRLIAVADGTAFYEKDRDGEEVFTASDLIAYWALCDKPHWSNKFEATKLAGFVKSSPEPCAEIFEPSLYLRFQTSVGELAIVSRMAPRVRTVLRL